MAQEGPARPATRPRSAPRRGLPFADLGSGPVFALVAAVAWEVTSRLYDAPYLLPAPSQILRALAEDSPVVLYYAGITTPETVLGFLLGSGVALLAGMLFAWLHRVQEALLYRIGVTLNS